ncbi:MAG TPA: argininosuccinate lyase [Thermoanaerobaculia bacterium]|nr:argininosuccinate lyase [Thermoanaerobaculia bacterium]
MTARTNLWGGGFEEAASARLSRLNDSLAFDRALLAEDVEGSIAWVGALRRARVLSAREARRLAAGLARVSRRAAPRRGHEDVHSYVEAALARHVGPLAGKLHSGRSRNDQVALDLRLWVKRALAEGRRGLLDVAEALARRAGAEAATAMPGYTHARRAEPVTFGHWCLAYVEMLRRDVSRFDDAFARADECPLGSAALAGTPLPVDRRALARRLGFARPTANSLDAVSDRDALVDYLHAGATALSHLSRFAEDVIAFSSDEHGFLALPDRLATGSSRMPHKKNPDLLELVRGHAARAAGDLAGLLALLKGLPLAYDKDLQLDKEPVFRLRETLAAVLPAVAELAVSLRLDRAAMRAAASDERLFAADLADALTERGVPFRRAHAAVGRRLARARRAGTTLAALAPGDGVEARDLSALDLDRALSRRGVLGGTSPVRVRQAACAASRWIAAARRRR